MKTRTCAQKYKQLLRTNFKEGQSWQPHQRRGWMPGLSARLRFRFCVFCFSLPVCSGVFWICFVSVLVERFRFCVFLDFKCFCFLGVFVSRVFLWGLKVFLFFLLCFWVCYEFFWGLPWGFYVSRVLGGRVLSCLGFFRWNKQNFWPLGVTKGILSLPSKREGGPLA